MASSRPSNRRHPGRRVMTPRRSSGRHAGGGGAAGRWGCSASCWRWWPRWWGSRCPGEARAGHRRRPGTRGRPEVQAGPGPSTGAGLAALHPAGGGADGPGRQPGGLGRRHQEPVRHERRGCALAHGDPAQPGRPVRGRTHHRRSRPSARTTCGWSSRTCPGSFPWRESQDGSDRGEGIDRSTDGGRTWTFSTLPGCLQLCGSIALSFVDADHGFAAVSSDQGNTGRTPGACSSTRPDGGATWQNRSPRRPISVGWRWAARRPCSKLLFTSTRGRLGGVGADRGARRHDEQPRRRALPHDRRRHDVVGGARACRRAACRSRPSSAAPTESSCATRRAVDGAGRLRHARRGSDVVAGHVAGCRLRHLQGRGALERSVLGRQPDPLVRGRRHEAVRHDRRRPPLDGDASGAGLPGVVRLLHLGTRRPGRGPVRPLHRGGDARPPVPAPCYPMLVSTTDGGRQWRDARV